MVEPNTTSSSDVFETSTAILGLPTVVHVRGYSKVDAIGSPEINVSGFFNEDQRRGIADLSIDSPEVADKSDPGPKAGEKKLSLFVYRILYLTELPFLIMWTYATYWTYLVAMYASHVRTMIWLSAAVASILVGVGLNANAYEMLSERETIDYGVVVRFFIIPFGVSTLSGMTNQLREQFLLVFPRDPTELCIAILLPTFVVGTLFVSRLIVLTRLPVTRSWSIVLLNTPEIKKLKPGPSLITRCLNKVLRVGKHSKKNKDRTPTTTGGGADGTSDCAEGSSKFNSGEPCTTDPDQRNLGLESSDV
eukprot:Selendium_serpulae@DN5746_c0_g1_i1.p1